jgi:D-alanyl-D-alanine carboxypeptidase (penicillin-binding protein 5/6)
VNRLGRLLAAAGAAGLVAGHATGAPAPRLDAAAYILVNPITGEVLARRAPDAPLPMASTTKIMTALLTLERARLGETARVPAEAAAVGGSTARLVPGERLSVRSLLVGLLVASGNDAAVTLADRVAGSQAAFVRLMNRRAAQLGLRHTEYATPHGLDRPGQHSSARDLVRLAEVAMANPVFRSIVSRRRATIPGAFGGPPRALESENDLLDIDPEADGVKTGHTSGAGYAMVAHARRRGLGLGLYAALIGEPSETQRALDARRLLDWGFAQYARPTLVPAGQVLGRAAVRDRPGVRVAARVVGPLRAVVRIGEPLRASVTMPPEVVAPVRAGQVLGSVAIRAGRRLVGRRPLVAATSVAAPSALDRVRAGWDRLVP